MNFSYRAIVAEAQAQCGRCDPLRNYVCTYHEGWEDGFEVGVNVAKLAVAQIMETE